MYFLGVDTGGTKTACIVTDEDYTLQGVGRSGPGNYYVAGKETARQNVEAAVQEALVDSGVTGTERIVGGFGMGNLDTAKDREIITSFLDTLEAVDETYLVNDVVLAHYAMMAGASGITVVAGTGAMAYGTGDDGTECRSSGWGWLLGDEGSGFYAARRGLQAALKATDNRGPSTMLVQKAQHHFETDSLEEVVTKVHDELDHPKKIASFAKPVAEAAASGDSVAGQIINDASDELALAAQAVHEELQLPSPVSIGCVGSFGSSPPVAKQFERKLTQKLPAVNILTPAENPVIGACVLIAKQLGQDISRTELQRLDRQITDR